jgi:hypothetical protein
MADESNDVPSSRPRLGARPFAGRPGERPTPAPAGGDQTLIRPFAAPVARPSRNSLASNAPIAEVWTITSNPDPLGAERNPPDVSAAVIDVEEPAAHIVGARPGDDVVDGVNVLLDEELRHFKLQSSEMPPVPTPFPELDAAAHNELGPAIVFVPAEHANEVRAALEEPAVAFRDPMDREFLAPDASQGAESEMALTEALDDAIQLSCRVDAANALDAVANRVRRGEIVLAPAGGTGSRSDAALLVAVLAALIGESA